MEKTALLETSINEIRFADLFETIELEQRLADIVSMSQWDPSSEPRPINLAV